MESKIIKPTCSWNFTVEGEDHAYTSKVKKNMIVVGYEKVAAALFMGYSASAGGIQYVEIGRGDGGWGVSPPAPDPSDTELDDPLGRVPPASKTFLDSDLYVDLSTPGSIIPISEPSRLVMVSFVLDYSDSTFDNEYIREVGLCGGGANATVGTGFISNIFRPDNPPFKTSALKVTFRAVLDFEI